MANSLWDRLNNKNKSKKSNYEISKKTNIPEEKVKEIMNGERIVPTDRVDALLGAIQEDNSMEKKMNLLEIKKWISETDLKKKRISMGYITQKDLAEALNINNSVICRLEQKNLSHISDNFLMKYYDFINDDLNIRIKKKGKPRVIRKTLSQDKKIIEKINGREAEKWYNDFDFKEYLIEHNLTYSRFAQILGYSRGSTSLISSLVSHKVNVETSGRAVVLRAYAYINGITESKEDAVKDEIVEDDKYIEETQNVSLDADMEATEPINHAPKQLCFDVTETVNLKNNNMSCGEIAPSSVTYVNNENIYHNGLVVDVENMRPTVAEETVKVSASKYNQMTKDLEEKDEEIERLKLQISRYEKLIDMIER